MNIKKSFLIIFSCFLLMLSGIIHFHNPKEIPLSDLAKLARIANEKRRKINL